MQIVTWTLFSVNYFFDVIQWLVLFIAFFYLLQKMREERLERGEQRDKEGHLFEWTECSYMDERELPYKGGMPLYGIVTPFMCTTVALS